MSLFKILAQVAGPVLGLPPVAQKLLPIVGSAIDQKNEQRRADAQGGKDFDAMIAAGERHGIHKLDMIRSSAPGMFAGTPLVASNEALSGMAESFVGEIDGTAELQRQRERRAHDLFMLETERSLAGGAGVIVKNTMAKAEGSTLGEQELEEAKGTVTADVSFVNPYYADAEVSEARRGDIAQEIAGVQNTIMDGEWNVALERYSRLGVSRSELHEHWASLGSMKAVREEWRKLDKQLDRMKAPGPMPLPSGPGRILPVPDDDMDERARIRDRALRY